MKTLLRPRVARMLLVALLVFAALVVVFRLGNEASAGVELSDPVVWIEDGARGRILQINGSTQEITAAVDVGENFDSLVAIPRGRDAGAVYLNKTSGELGVIGAISLDVDGTEELTSSGEQLELLGNLRIATEAYVVDSDRILVLEPGGGEPVTIPTPAGLGSHVVAGDGRLIAVTVDSQQIGVTTARGLEPLAMLPPPLGPDAEPPALATAGGSVYVVDAARRSVNLVSSSGELGPTTCVAGSLVDVQVGGNHVTDSVEPHRVLVHDSAAGLLSVTNVDENDCDEIDLGVVGSDWGRPVAVDDVAYLPNYETGRILIVDLTERVVLDAVRFGRGGGSVFELEVFDGAVWANEPLGAFAAIVSRDQIQPILKNRNVVVTDSNDEGGGDLGGLLEGENENDGRVFSGEGDLAAPGDGVAGDNAVGGGGEQPGGGGEGDPTVEGDEDGPSATDLPNSPVLVEVIEPNQVQLDELVANFVFSASTVNVGEEVTFADDSIGNPTSFNWDFGDGTGAEGPDVVKVWDSEGIFTVTLFVTNARGEAAQQSLDITVVAVDVLRVPTADFSFRSGTIEVGETIEFVDESSGEPESLLWAFGDGEVASGSVVSHVYEEAGTYEVSLTASNAAGPNTTSAIITVVDGVQAPEAIIGRFPGVVEVGQTVTLTSESTNSPTAVSWRFDDGDSALGASVRHAWKAPGTYRIYLAVSNSAGADESFADIVVEPRVNPPVARFGQSSLQVVEGETISFNDLSLNNPDSLTWEFGDGATARGANVSHSWDNPGTYTVTLTARNDAGSDDVAKTVTVIPLPPDPPNAGFTVASATVPVNSVVNFINTSTGDPTEFLWDFDDGSTSPAQSPPHSFATPGTYEVTLTASNAGGSDSITKTVVVVDPPTASFTRTVEELVVTFADTSVNQPTSWDWDFGDGTSSAAQNPAKTFAAAGTYTVTLISTNDAGSSAPFTATVTVAELPVAGFSVVTGGLTAQFTDTSTAGPTAWLWDFGDGTTSTVQNPTRNYAAGGTYPVTLTVSNPAGSDTQTTNVTVAVAPPVPDIQCTVVGAGVACDGSGSTGAVSYSWSSPSAVSSSGTGTANASFTYGATGTYNITLTVENTVGATASLTEQVTVTVPQPPTISGIVVVTNNNGVVELSGTATNSPTSWNWTAPGATISGGATANPTLTYTTSGSKTVTATATNAVGTSAPSPITFSVTVLPPPPTVTGVTAIEGVAGSVAASATTTGGAPTSWSWSVPGSNQGTSTAAGPTFTFAADGSYPGTVTASNAGGTSNTFSFTITVSGFPPPIADFTFVDQGGGVVAFTNNSTTTGTATYSYTFAGGTPASSTNPNPSVTFAPVPGSYSVTLMVTDAGGTNSITKPVAVA